MSSSTQTARVISLAQALASSRRGVVLKQFAERNGWPLRYVYRDVQTVERAGFPIAHADGRYWLPRGWTEVAPGAVAPDELLAPVICRAGRRTSVGRDRLREASNDDPGAGAGGGDAAGGSRVVPAARWRSRRSG